MNCYLSPLLTERNLIFLIVLRKYCLKRVIVQTFSTFSWHGSGCVCLKNCWATLNSLIFQAQYETWYFVVISIEENSVHVIVIWFCFYVYCFSTTPDTTSVRSYRSLYMKYWSVSCSKFLKPGVRWAEAPDSTVGFLVALRSDHKFPNLSILIRSIKIP